MSTDASDVASDAPASDEKPKLSLDVKVDNPSACERHVTVTVSREDIDRYFGDAVDELMPRAEVSGFRPGRAPRKLVESRFRPQLAEQVKGSLLMDTLTQVGEDCDFSAISEPDFDYEAIELPEEGPMTFEFNIEVRPEFDMPSWDGLELTRPVDEISDEAVEERTKALLAREGKLVDREDGAQEGDVLTVDIHFSLDGKPLSSIHEQTLVVREKLSFMDGELDGFDKLAAGAKKGGKLETKISISDGAENEELRGKEVDAKFDIKSVRYLEIPELNQQFLEKIGGFSSPDELYSIVRDEMERQLTYKQQQALRKQITEKLTEGADWELPPTLLKRQANRELERAVLELQSSGFSNDMIRHHANQLRQNMEESTRTALQEHFILERIAEEHDLEAEPQDYEREIMMVAMQRNESPRKVRARIEKRGQMDSLRNQIVERKAIDLITSKAKITEEPVQGDNEETAYAIEHSITGESESAIPEAKYDDKPDEKLPGSTPPADADE